MTDNKTDYFRTFCKISKAFGTTYKKEELLDIIVQSAIDSMDGKAACLFLADREADTFVSVAQKGLSENYLHANSVSARKTVEEILKTGYLAIRDATTDPRMQHHEAKKAEGIASILDVPVIVNDKLIGVLALYTGTPRDFSQDETDFLSALAEQGGMAIQNTRLLERMKQNAMLFHDLADSINSSLDIKQIFHILTADIAEAFGMKGVNVRLLNKESDTLELVASYGLSEEFLNKGPVSADKSVAQALKGETVIIMDATTDERVQYRAAMKKEGIVSMVCVSIQSGDDIIGVMRMYSSVERKFPEDMVILLEALAHQGGIAIQNASMYLMLQDDMKNLEEEIWSHRSWF